ncbi:MAG: FG-GAP repeat protein [Planctomycetes bacterium]|nr:FG-GAP repeat protein [Planctomycetota bacterium]
MRAIPIIFLAAACSTPERPLQVQMATQIEGSTSPSLPARFRSRLLRTLPPYQQHWTVEHIESVGDWDGDGIVDLAVSNSDSANKDTRGNPYGAAGVLILSSRDGRQVAALLGAPEIVHSPTLWRWEKRFTTLGDIDSDKRSDVALLSSGIRADGTRGAVLCAFGNGRPDPIWKQDITVPNGCMPFTLQRVGDLDRDGIRDLAIGVPPYDGGPSPPAWTDAAGFVEVRSGKDGHALWQLRGEIGMRTGWQMARHADVDGDGIEELAVLVIARDPSDSGVGSNERQPRVDILRGSTGETLRSIPGAPDPSWTRRESMVPFQLVGGEDIDGDGFSDLTIRTLRTGEPNVLDVLSGRDDSVLARMTAHPDPNGREDGWFPSAVAIGSDVDGDGWRDLLLGHDEVGNEQGYDWGAIYVQSARTNALLAAVWGTQEDSKLGDAIAWLGDTDGDGAPEFAAPTTQGIKIWAIERDGAK